MILFLSLGLITLMKHHVKQVTMIVAGPSKISECFASQQSTKAIATPFPYYIAKILPTSYFGYFAHVWPLPSKAIMPTCRTCFVYPHAKNELPH